MKSSHPKHGMLSIFDSFSECRCETNCVCCEGNAFYVKFVNFYISSKPSVSYPDEFSYCGIGMGAHILSLNILEQFFLKKTYKKLRQGWEVHFKPIDTLNSKNVS